MEAHAEAHAEAHVEAHEEEIATGHRIILLR
ncbi:hypothetical protein SO3561_02382 [Streptomyces olivochromogenes]|uniref:Uncharacterized protein n=1 Tax=Streptomyces olivochromogenes TaxID=1963 RepID=A0A250V9L6_STROL|nr:hypothetical protein SO3561_02382 [Streptomyces olivochromogenes]